jgi:hypothetical protein
MVNQTFCHECDRSEGADPVEFCSSCFKLCQTKCCKQSEGASVNGWLCGTSEQQINLSSKSLRTIPKVAENLNNEEVQSKILSALERSISRSKELFEENVALEQRIEALEEMIKNSNLNQNEQRLLKSIDEFDGPDRIDPIQLEAERAERQRLRMKRLLDEEERMSRMSSLRCSTRINQPTNSRSQRDDDGDVSIMSSSTTTDHQSMSVVEKYLISQELEKLPDFSGDIEQWPEFLKIYQETTRDGKFSDVENLNRLKNHIKPPAKDLLGVVMEGNTTAERIMEALHSMYGRSEIILGKYTKELLNVPDITSKTDVKIKNFDMKLNGYCGLIDVKMESSLQNAPMEAVSLQKLEKAPSMYSRWMSIKRSKTLTVEDFTKFITTVWTEMPPENRDSTKKFVKDDRWNSSSDECDLCYMSDHIIESCEEFLSRPPRERYKIAMEKGLCLGCLANDHETFECGQRILCQVDGCRREHHHLIHVTPHQEEGQKLKDELVYGVIKMRM